MERTRPEAERPRWSRRSSGRAVSLIGFDQGLLELLAARPTSKRLAELPAAIALPESMLVAVVESTRDKPITHKSTAIPVARKCMWDPLFTRYV